MQIQAKVISRYPQRSGTSATGKSWVSQSYMVQYDYDQQYPKSLALDFFGEQRVNEAAQLLHSDTIATFDFDPTSREVTRQDGSKMVFTSCSCYRITIPTSAAVNGSASAAAPVSGGASTAQTSFGGVSTPPPPPSSNDELPF